MARRRIGRVGGFFAFIGFDTVATLAEETKIRGGFAVRNLRFLSD